MLSLLQLKASQTECEYGGVLHLSKDIFICTYYGENRWIGKPKHNDGVYTHYVFQILPYWYFVHMEPAFFNTSTIQHLYNPTPLQSNTSTIQYPL